LGDLPRQTLLVLNGDAGWISLCGKEEGIGLDDPLALVRHLVDDELDRLNFALFAGAEQPGDLLKGAGNLVQTRDVGVVVPNGIKRNALGQIDEPKVNRDLWGKCPTFD